MLQHIQENNETSSVSQHSNAEHQTEPRIAAYLEGVCRSLELDDARRVEARSEMLVHIESLIEANIALGDSRELAIKHALTQFGKTRAIRRDWKRTCSDTLTFKPALYTALRLNGATGLAAGVIYSVCLRFMTLSSFVWVLCDKMIWYTFHVLPVLTGLSIGLQAKKWSMLATLTSMLLLLAPMTVIDANLSQFLSPKLFPDGAARMWVIDFLIFWIPLGCSGAGVGSLIRWLMRPRYRNQVFSR